MASSNPPDFKHAISVFYQQYNPEKIDQVDKNISKYKGQESVLVKMLEKKYSVTFDLFLYWRNGNNNSMVPDADPEGKYSHYVKTASGLRYFDNELGTGASVLSGDRLSMHYTGWLDCINGQKCFDDSLKKNKPFEFVAGHGSVIRGWDEAVLIDFKVGGQRSVVIPWHLAYGAQGKEGMIPPKSVLFFTMRLLSINGTGTSSLKSGFGSFVSSPFATSASATVFPSTLGFSGVGSGSPQTFASPSFVTSSQSAVGSFSNSSVTPVSIYVL